MSTVIRLSSSDGASRPRRRTGFFRTALVGLLAVLAAGCAATAGSASPATQKPAGPSPALLADLAPSGKLLVAVQTPPPFLAQNDTATGEYIGVAVAMAAALAARLGVPLEIVEVDAPPQILAGAGSGKWDIAFLPITEATAQAVDLTAPFILVGHTFIVRADSSFHNITDADKPGIRIASGTDAVHTPPLAAYLKQAQLVKVDETAAIAMLKAGQVDAYADNRFALIKMASQDSSLRVLDGDFFVVKLGVAVAKGHADGLAYLTQFVEEAKSSGMVQKAIDATGLALTVAPAQ
jgi:polar amino acid transport system substrate-binding protein